mmetsp:Transcript_7694/g.16432  ORF Transcript_7694/g.16432 Transcript_7694/m.16432 type:complete len:168 (-) Transcript_7694:230-733(-)
MISKSSIILSSTVFISLSTPPRFAASFQLTPPSHASLTLRQSQGSTFISMPSDDDYDEKVAPKPKKAKTKKASEDEEDDGAEGENGKADKVQRNEDGEAYFDFSKNKRCTVRKWRDMVLVDIREFYEKNGEKKPGKKGISLTLDQYKSLREIIMDGSLDEQIKALEK